MIVKHTRTGLLFCVWLLVPSLAAAQPGPAAQNRTRGDRAQMYEDIEVFRRLLNSKLLSQYAPARQLSEVWGLTSILDASSPGGAVLSPNALLDLGDPNHNRYQILSDGKLNANTIWGQQLSPFDQNQNSQKPWYQPVQPGWDLGQQWRNPYVPSAPALNTEGVYLRGQGVVYTLTLPLPLPPQAKPEPAQAPVKPVSDWDRVRRELHNEKPEPERKEPPRREPRLEEIILRVLMENGHHFTQLAENESISVVVTFRGGRHTPGKIEATFQSKAGSAPQTHSGGGSDSSQQDYELLGDLHLKQGKLAEALEAYRRAVKENEDPKRSAALYRKLARALLAMDRTEEARQVLDQALEHQNKGQGASAQPSRPADTGRVSLPAKLILGASRRLLDEAAGGRMSLEEFEKAANREYMNWPAATP
jgi:tetratricopeptide (TPR) repeat protein